MSSANNRVVTLGEIMLRLKSPGFERLLQSPILEATFGGGEANVAASLANFGVDAAYVTVLARECGRRCLHCLPQSRSIDTSLVVRGGDRLGIYFFETGSNQRPSVVVYDRAGAAIANVDPREHGLGRRSSKARTGSTSPASPLPSASVPQNCPWRRCATQRNAA